MYGIHPEVIPRVRPNAGVKHGAHVSMHRVFWSALIVWLALIGTAREAQAETGPRVEARRITDSVYFVQGVAALGSPKNRNFISNAAFVVTPAGVVVIDALGSPVLAEELLRVIRGLTPRPVTHVIVTHYHADHVYGLQTFRQAGARIVAQRRSQEYLGSDLAQQRLAASREDLAPWVDDKTQLTAPDLWLDEEMDLVVGGVQFQIRHVGPAHTPEDSVVYLPALKVLFAGDMVFRGRIPFVGQADSGRWVAGLDKLLEFDARWVVPGHGPVSVTARDDLTVTRDYLVFLRQAMGEAARNLEPFDEAYERIDWSRFESIPMFTLANRINAYNTYLQLEQGK